MFQVLQTLEQNQYSLPSHDFSGLGVAEMQNEIISSKVTSKANYLKVRKARKKNIRQPFLKDEKQTYGILPG